MILTSSILASPFLASSILAIAIQVGPNQQSVPPSDGHAELRDRPPQEGDGDTPSDPSSGWLAECLALVSENPARAHTQAQIRRNETSGTDRVLANHCLGLAATELGLWEDAISAFGDARDETPSDELRAQARLGTMAGNAALASGDPQRATAILQRAKTDAQGAASAPLQAIAATDLARAFVELGMGEEALAELEIATRLQPDDAEGWLLTATLLRRLDRLELAQTAIERAGELAPLESPIGLEAGVIAVLSGRDEAARQSWQSVIDIQPDSMAAQTAGDYLAQLGPTPAPTPIGAETAPAEQDPS